MVKILQGSVVTQTVLGELAINPQVANFLWCTCAKNYANWLAVDKVIAKTKRVPIFETQCIIHMFKATVYQQQIDIMVTRAVPNRRLTVFGRIQIVVPTMWPNMKTR